MCYQDNNIINPQSQPKQSVSNNPTVALVMRDLVDRAEFGLEKYGTYHYTDNGRDHLIDAYQEALDLVIYLRAEIERRRFNEQKLEEVRKANLQIARRGQAGG